MMFDCDPQELPGDWYYPWKGCFGLIGENIGVNFSRFLHLMHFNLRHSPVMLFLSDIVGIQSATMVKFVP